MKRKLQVRMTPEYLRSLARREAQYIGRRGWRLSRKDIKQLKDSRHDALAYLTLARAWRAAGFPLTAIKRIAGRIRKPRAAVTAQTEGVINNDDYLAP
jgi:hypothetical protein